VWEAAYNGFAYLNIRGSIADEYGNYTLAYEISDPVAVHGSPDDKAVSDIIRVYPNPVSSCIHLESKQVKFTKVVMYDYTGRMIRIFGMEAPVKSFESGDLRLSQGLYILAIETDRGKVFKRVEIVR
jgi:hypothetical protein